MEGIISLIRELGEKEKAKIYALPGFKRVDIDTYLGKLSKKLPQVIKELICAKGYTKIDTSEERDELAKKITAQIGKMIPDQYKPLWPFIKPVVNKIVRMMLEEAGKQGKKYCDGVSCTLLPIEIK